MGLLPVVDQCASFVDQHLLFNLLLLTSAVAGFIAAYDIFKFSAAVQVGSCLSSNLGRTTPSKQKGFHKQGRTILLTRPHSTLPSRTP